MQVWSGQIFQQRGVRDFFRAWRHCIAVANVQLDPAACLAEAAHQSDAQATVARILANLLDHDRSGIESHSVFAGDCADLRNRTSKGFSVRGSEAKKIRVACRAVW